MKVFNSCRWLFLISMIQCHLHFSSRQWFSYFYNTFSVLNMCCYFLICWQYFEIVDYLFTECVFYSWLFPTVPPTIFDLKNMTQSENHATTLLCQSYGDPAPDMWFQKAGNPDNYTMGDNVSWCTVRTPLFLLVVKISMLFNLRKPYFYVVGRRENHDV